MLRQLISVRQISLLVHEMNRVECVEHAWERENGKLGNVSKSFRGKNACDTRANVRGNSHRESTKSEKQDSKCRRNTPRNGETKLRDNHHDSLRAHLGH